MIDGKYKYFAFISYKEEDAEWAKWLQHKLEHDKIPTITRKENPEFPEYIRPIYEYKSEAGGGGLENELLKGLESSKFLIVICSPRSGGDKSQWVNNGIRHFIKLGLEENIIPFIVEGKVKAENPNEECFPSALLELKGKRERRGININELGRDAAAVKVVSAMFDVAFDSLWQRHEKEKEEERRRLKEQNDKLLIAQSRFLAEKANQLVEDGDSYMARLLALKILPRDVKDPNISPYVLKERVETEESRDDIDRPYTPEADASLRNSVMNDNAIFRGHTDRTIFVRFSPSGNKIASSSYDKTIRIWDVNSGKVQVLDGLTSCACTVSFIHDEKELLSVSWDGTFCIWDLETGTQLDAYRGVLGCINSASFNSDCNRIAATSKDNLIHIIDTQTGKELKTLEGHNDQVISTDFCYDGKRIVSTSHDHTIRIWDIDKDSPIHTIKEYNSVCDATFSPDGKRIVSSLDGRTICILDAETGKEFELFERSEGHSGCIYILMFNFNGQKVVSASEDGTICIWDAKTGDKLQTLKGHLGNVYSAVFNPDGTKIASVSADMTIRLWQLTDNNSPLILKGHTAIVISVSFSLHDNGSRIVSSSGDGTIRIWDVQTGKELLSPLKGHKGNVNSVVFCPDGNRIISASADKTVRIWNARTGEQIGQPLEGHSKYINSVAYCSKEEKIVSASDDGTVIIWNAQTGDRLHTLNHIGKVLSVAIRQDGQKIVSASYSKTIKTLCIWDANTGNLLKTISDGIPDTITSVNFSPDGKTIVSTSVDHTVGVWDVLTGEKLHTLEGHTSCVYSASYSPNGKYIVSSSADTTVRVWSAENGLLLQTFKGHSDLVHSVVFSPDGKRFASASFDKTIRIWDFPPLQKLINDTHTRFKNRELTPEEKKKYYLE